MEISQTTVCQLWTFLQRYAPREACGVLASDDGCRYVRIHMMVNYAPQPTKEFWINPQELGYIQSRETLPVILWHSHPTSRWDLSRLDCEVIRLTNVPMVLVAAMPVPSVLVYELTPEQHIVVSCRYDALTGEPICMDPAREIRHGH